MMRDALVCPVEACFRHKRPFGSKNNLQQHIHSLHSGRPYKCDRCERSFGLRYRCESHKVECGFKFECSQCESYLPSSQALELHCRRTGHTTKPAQEQLIESRRVSPEVHEKRLTGRKRKTRPIPQLVGEMRTPVHPSYLASLLINRIDQKKMQRIKKRRSFREMSTQTDAVLYHPMSAPYLMSEPLATPYLPPSLLLSDTQTQTQATVSHTEAVQTNLMLSTEHACVQTLLSNERWSPQWSPFFAQPDNLFDFGTQTYESLLGQELGLTDSSVQTYF